MLSCDDIGAIALLVGLLGGVTLLGIEAAWWAGLGLFFALLVAWGVLVLRASELEVAGRPDVENEASMHLDD